MEQADAVVRRQDEVSTGRIQGVVKTSLDSDCSQNTGSQDTEG